MELAVLGCLLRLPSFYKVGRTLDGFKFQELHLVKERKKCFGIYTSAASQREKLLTSLRWCEIAELNSAHSGPLETEAWLREQIGVRKSTVSDPGLRSGTRDAAALRCVGRECGLLAFFCKDVVRNT